MIVEKRKEVFPKVETQVGLMLKDIAVDADKYRACAKLDAIMKLLIQVRIEIEEDKL